MPLSLQHPLSDPAPAGLPPPTETPINSRTLLQGQRSIAILHNGTVYRLQATRLGKLILTK